MNLFVVNIILFVLAVIAVGLILGVMAKLMWHGIVGILFWIVFTVICIVMCVKLSNGLTKMIGSEYSRSEVIAQKDILDIQYKNDYVYITFIDDDGKVITERNDRVIVHQHTDSRYFVNKKCSRWFVYWYEWEVYLE